MAGVRAYIFSPPGSPSCPPDAVNGCYNTGHIDTNAPAGQACLNPDPQQFGSLQDLIAYANSHGEALRQFNSVAEVNAVCGASSVSVAPSGSPSTTGVGACGMGPCGPTAPAPAGTATTTTAGGGGGGGGGTTAPVVTSSPSGQTTVQSGGSPSPSPTSGSFSGGASGFGTNTSAKGTGASVTTAGAGTSTPSGTAVSVTGFDILAFIKSPLGILLIVLLLIVLMLTRKGG